MTTVYTTAIVMGRGNASRLTLRWASLGITKAGIVGAEPRQQGVACPAKPSRSGVGGRRCVVEGVEQAVEGAMPASANVPDARSPVPLGRRPARDAIC